MSSMGAPLANEAYSLDFGENVELLCLSLLGFHVQIRSEDPHALALLEMNYGGLRGSSGRADLTYTVSRETGSCSFVVVKNGQDLFVAADESDLIFFFEKDMTIELQRHRRDLYFVHSAALEFEGKAFMLVASSGTGKSTTAWALLHHGCRYLSDELGPVELRSLRVHPYPHAICLKRTPPPSYPLPHRTLYTSRTLHIPAERLPAEVCDEPMPLKAIFFLHRWPENTAPAVQTISRAEAGARLLANALNPLAHAGDGLDGALAISGRVASFNLFAADLSSTCALVKSTLQGLSPGVRERAFKPFLVS